jgi:methylglutaconyl-CoA hydratase
MSDVELVHLALDDDVAILTLDSLPNRNALSEMLRWQLLEALDEVDRMRGVRVLVLTHTGPVFCSGLDLHETHRRGSGEDALRQYASLLLKLSGHRLPVVARVAGPARGGGVGLAAAADIVVATAGANFALTEARLGLIPAVVEIPLRARVSPTALRELALTGSVVSAEEARRIGLVNRLAVDIPDLDIVVAKVVAELRLGGPHALAGIKSLLAPPGVDEALYNARIALSAEYFEQCEAHEALRARLERRDPEWASHRKLEHITLNHVTVDHVSVSRTAGQQN